jgi:hypothetical protein
MNIKKINEQLDHLRSVLSEGIAETIVNQIGQRALYMMGAKQLMKGKGSGGEYIQFKIGRNPKNVNMVKVEYDHGRDLYNLYFYNYRGTTLKLLSSEKGVYVDMLHKILKNHTGMEMSL